MKRLVTKILLSDYDGRKYKMELKPPVLVDENNIRQVKEQLLDGFCKAAPQALFTKINFIS